MSVPGMEREGESRAPGEILIVDDNPTNLDLLSGMLLARKYRVRAATGGRRAIATARAFVPDLIMLDINMPEMNGYEVCRALKGEEATREIPVIFISALDEALDKVRAFGSGGVDYVTKPFQFEEVLARIEHQLKISRLSREMAKKNQQLAEAYEALQKAQDEVERLSAPSSRLLEDTAAWARAIAEDVARAIGATRIGVFTLETDTDHFVPLAADEGLAAPGWSAPRGAPGPRELRAAPGTRALAVVGLSGETRGALVIEGLLDGAVARRGEPDAASWRIVSGFAHHLGSALELRHFRNQLLAAEARHAATRRELHERGIETLGLCPTCGRCQSDGGPDSNPAPDAPAPVCEVDGTPLDTSRLLPFRIAGRYRLARLLGEGGMGTVFRANDERLTRDVALKIIRASHLNDPTMRLRLEREARVIARIRHPGVIEVHDSGELEDGSVYVVMELLRGRDLSGIIQEYGSATPVQTASLLVQAAEALAAAHENGVIHRDIKPANLFLVPGGEGFRVKVLDFGVAKTNRFDSEVTMTGMVVGTPAYMTPEQMLGRSVDERSDLYSLAAVVYEALVGRRAIPSSKEGREEGDQMTDTLFANPLPVSALLNQATPDVDALFDRALAKKASARPRNLLEWARALADLLRVLPASRPGWPPDFLRVSGEHVQPAVALDPTRQLPGSVERGPA